MLSSLLLRQKKLFRPMLHIKVEALSTRPNYFQQHRKKWTLGLIGGGLIAYTYHKMQQNSLAPTEEKSLASGTFQENKTQTVKERIFAKLKVIDGGIMLRFIREFKPNWRAEKQAHLTVTDLGGGDGDMLDYFLPLAQKHTLHVNEPNSTLKAKYLQKIKQPQYAACLENITSSTNKMEDPNYTIPASDFLLASHSLYFPQNWQEPPTKETKKNHLLTKLISALKQDGVLCVILLSNAPTTITAKNRSMTAGLAEVEAFTYPLMGRDSKNCIYAESLEEALDDYNRFFKQTAGYQPLSWQTAPLSICPVMLGDINFIPHPETGRYKQTSEVEALLNFYTRKCYSQWPPSKQKQWLDFIKENCATQEGSYVITHVNKIIVIMRTPSMMEPSVALRM